MYHLIDKSRMIMSYGVKSMTIKCAIKIDKRGVILMLKLLMYFLFLPFWLIWWFIKLVFYFMAWLEVCLLSFNGKRIIRRRW